MADLAPTAPSMPLPATAAAEPSAAARAGAVATPAALPAAVSGPVAPAPEAPARTREALQRQIDRALENADTSLRFRVDDELGRVVVSVIDSRGEIVMQIPDAAALAVARRFARSGSLLDASA